MKHAPLPKDGRRRFRPSFLRATEDGKRILLIGSITLALFAGAAGLRWALTSRPQSTIGGPYALIDGHRRLVTQQDFRGRDTLIYFGYTHCVDVCPLTLSTVSAALDELGPKARNVTPLFISIDPQRDTPSVVQAYVAQFSPRIVGLTGTDAQLGPVRSAFHILARTRARKDGDYLVDHTSLLYLMDGRNRLLGMIPVDSSAHQIAADLERLLRKD